MYSRTPPGRYRGRTIILKNHLPILLSIYIFLCFGAGVAAGQLSAAIGFTPAFSDAGIKYIISGSIPSVCAAEDIGGGYFKRIASALLGFDPQSPAGILGGKIAALAAYRAASGADISLSGMESGYLSSSVPKPSAPPLAQNMLPIKDITTWKTGVSGYISTKGLYMRNESRYTPNLDEYLSAPLPFDIDDNGYQMLVISSHSTEAFMESDTDYYEAGEEERSTDINKNVVCVGAEVAKVLNANGIKTLHETGLNDYPSYNGSYTRTLKVIEWYLEKYPTIKAVLDIHRDSMIQNDGTKLRPVAEIDGQKAAQIMLVIGTDEGGLHHPYWKNNLNFGTKIQNSLNTLYPKLARPINLRAERFNQHATYGSLIFEMGSSGNTLAEAKRSGEYLGNAIVRACRG